MEQPNNKKIECAPSQSRLERLVRSSQAYRSGMVFVGNCSMLDEWFNETLSYLRQGVHTYNPKPCHLEADGRTACQVELDKLVHHHSTQGQGSVHHQ